MDSKGEIKPTRLSLHTCIKLLSNYSQAEDNTVLGIRSGDYMDDETTPIIHRSELSLKTIKNTIFVGKYYCVSAIFEKTFKIKVLDEYVTYIFVKGRYV